MARDIKFLVKDIEEATINAARTACVEIMNGLVEAGPGYSGEFSSAWYAVEQGQSPGKPRSKQGLYKYDLRNVPKTKFKSSGVWFQIVNGADHAAEAMDLVEGRFISQLDQDKYPIKDPVATGKRTGARRGEVSSGEGFAISTAPLDWWPTYNVGGALSRDLTRGVQQGFGKTRGSR